MIEVSVVLAVRDGESTIADQLQALAGQRTSRPWELVVADNGSTDRTLEIVESFRDQLPVRVVEASTGIGAGYAKTVGGRHAVGSVLLFCDADDAVDPVWLDRLASGVEEFGYVGGAIDRRRFATDLDRLTRERTTTLHLTADRHEFAVGANLGVTRQLFDRVGGFDADFVGGNEDADFALQLLEVGVRPQFVADAVVHYRDRVSLRAVFSQYRRYGRTEPLLRKKHAPRVSSRTLIDGLRYWASLLRVAVRGLRSPADRVLAVRTLGRGVGRIQGSIEFRVMFV